MYFSLVTEIARIRDLLNFSLENSNPNFVSTDLIFQLIDGRISTKIYLTNEDIKSPRYLVKKINNATTNEEIKQLANQVLFF
jgi:hypothetical protein